MAAQISSVSSEFAGHQGTSYFAVEFGDRIVVGLDSAYYADLDGGETDQCQGRIRGHRGLGGGTLHLAGMSMSGVEGPDFFWDIARATVQDEAGDPVEGATVTGSWIIDGLAEGDVTDDTNIRGTAVFKRANTGWEGPLQFCVSDVTKPGYTYDPIQNTSPVCSAR